VHEGASEELGPIPIGTPRSSTRRLLNLIRTQPPVSRLNPGRFIAWVTLRNGSGKDRLAQAGEVLCMVHIDAR
jgi:hypothetical protein